MKTIASHLIPAVLAVGLLGAGAAQARTETCHYTNQKTVASLFDRWNDSLKTLDPLKVAANYAPSAILLATVENDPRTTPAEIKDYFTKFLELQPQGQIDKRFVRTGCNIAKDVGVYTFTMKDGQKVQARYTYVYEWVNGKWLITHHHSSAMPEKS